jgi:hypothetical protein
MMIIQGLCQSNSQQIISQYVDDILFTAWGEDPSVNNLVRILYNFRFAYGPELIGIRVWRTGVGQGTPLGWVEKYQWMWATNGDLLKVLGTPFGLHVGLHNVDHFLVDMVKSKLKYWSSTHLSLVGWTLIVN